MTTPRTLKQRLATVSRLWDDEDYDKALVEVEALLKTWPGNPHLHVLRASLVQLQEDPKVDLDEAKQELQQAIELDRKSPAASIELGHYLDSVEDDPQAAVKAYGDAVTAARHLLIDGLIGQAKAFRQLDRKDEFMRCLHEVLSLAQFDPEARRHKNGKIGAGIIVHDPSGQVYAAQLKGPYAEQLQELLGELAVDRQVQRP